MLKKLIFALSLLATQATVYGQLADGSTAPNFTLTDYYGTEHNLYDYLDAGKTVIVEIFAAHCPTCWGYHQAHTLKNLYNDYGPEGTDEVMVLALEHDEFNNHNSFIGIGPPWHTAGDWLEGTPYPIFNVEGSDRSVFDDYNVIGYPVVYKICPNKITERVSISESDAQLYEKVEGCQATLSINENIDLGRIYYNPSLRTLSIDKYQQVRSIRIMSITGQVVQTIRSIHSPSIQIQQMNTGVYFFEFQTANGPLVRRFFLD